MRGPRFSDSPYECLCLDDLRRVGTLGETVEEIRYQQLCVHKVAALPAQHPQSRRHTNSSILACWSRATETDVSNRPLGALRSFACRRARREHDAPVTRTPARDSATLTGTASEENSRTRTRWFLGVSARIGRDPLAKRLGDGAVALVRAGILAHLEVLSEQSALAAGERAGIAYERLAGAPGDT